MQGLKRLTMTAAVIAATVVATAAVADRGGDPGPGGGGAGHGGYGLERSYTVGLFGDMPYGAAGRTEYPRLLGDMNAARPAFAIFDGDLKAGGDGACTDELYTQSKAWFDSLRFPVVVTPGDNDWTDCWGRYGPGTGGYDPEERLAFERRLFFADERTLGARPMRVERESTEAGYADYSENARWVAGPVLYVTLDFQGSNDNLPHAGVDGETRSDAEIARQEAEHDARQAANIHWLQESYVKATQIGARGVVVTWQSDPNFNNEQKLQPEEYDGLLDLPAELRRQAIAFPGQTLLVHGDSHYYKVDKPLSYDNGQVVEKFTRVETFGAANTHWVSLTVDPRDPQLFQLSPQIVAGNVDDR
ncbi:hypothetical protein FSW04_23650 [Baekduia soli]|uniref:Calcineurin-like phosphoesterase domain-containing protein n=1 Tax=Baekduia soli TaxID=496014 RepID=A0A5B8UC97_9ACTN|nr:hypothetical protein [Baekduia soli]QEC50281.1 hypothetical protein FSW04_23650 [Baekduia soli]